MANPVHDIPPPLAQLARAAPLALFLDFDGTLVDIAARPDAITVPAGMAARLGALSGQLAGRLALVSGRSLADLEGHTGPLSIARAGSHGIARILASGASLDGETAELPPEAVAEMRAFSRERGLLLEEKPHGAALHYRAAPGLEATVLAFADGLATRRALQAKRGKCVVELVHPGADKGGAVHAFMQSPPFAGARPVFVGDDVTDEDGFAAAAALGGFGIIVGGRSPTAARYGLADVAAVHEWLAL